MDVIEMVLERIREEKNKKERAVVFWYDSSGQETVASLVESLVDEQVIVRELTENNFFKLKIEIEIKHPDESYLLYAPFSRPSDEENYLLDILLYGSEFKADQIAIWAEQLAVKDVILRSIVNRYPNFFNSKERREKLKKVISPSPKEEELEYGILAVLTSAPVANISLITKYLFLSGLEEDSNEIYKKINKSFSIDRMWELLGQYFGVRLSEDQRTLRYLMEHLLYSHFSRDSALEIKSLSDKYPTVRANICALFIDDWLRSKTDEVEILETYIKEMEYDINLCNHLQEKPIEQFDKVFTFPLVDVLLIEKLTEELQHKTTDLVAWKDRISFRLSTYWGRKSKITGLYRTLFEAVLLTDYKTYLKQYDTRKGLYDQYATNLHVIDQTYRGFMHSYTELEQRELVEPLAEILTNWYENIYLRKLADETNFILSNDQHSNIPMQKGFFKKTIQPILEKESTRVFVIISDALRYEVGYELSERLNGRINGEASVSPMLGSLPTYTQLGMASLLPHRTLTVGQNKIVCADGEPTNGIANRTKILQKAHPDAVAYRLDEFSDWSRAESEEKFKGKRLVYLYHDVIDATGDSRKSERETYAASEKAINDLELAVDRLARLQAKRIFITADHGFLFQYPKVEADVKIEAVKGTVFDSNRRFAIGQGLNIPEGAIKLSEGQTPLIDSEVVITKGLNRFTGGGGLQFIHGGAMPQEVIVPLIDYRRTDRAELVDISVAMLDKVITNYRIPITFYQEESMSNDYLPHQIKAAFYIDNERISNEVLFTFNLIGENHQRTEQLTFSLAETYYPMGQVCILRIETVLDKKNEFYKEETFTIRMYEALY
jgi:uncharacterized protein (TIGR02687 family)